MALLAAALAPTPVAALAEPAPITAKRAEARQVLAEIDALDVSLEQAVERYNRATVRLSAIENAQAVNRRELAIARRNLKREQAALARHLVAMYSSDEDSSSIGVLLGASSLTDYLDRLDTLERIADQDVRVSRQVKQFKHSIERQKQRLAQAHKRQDALVAERAQERAAINDKLAERRQLVASIKSEIERLQAEERARQERLRKEAAARLAAERAEAARQRVEREAAREAAIERARQAGASREQAQAVAEAVAPDPSGDTGVVALTPDAAVVPSSALGSQAVSISMQYLGVPYVWGGATPSGFDCSGLIVYVFAQLGRTLPHYTGDLWNQGVPVSRDQLQVGDLVFFNGLGHMGMYMGGGQFIHAPHTGDVVKISSMSDSWYTSTYEGARRIL